MLPPTCPPPPLCLKCYQPLALPHPCLKFDQPLAWPPLPVKNVTPFPYAAVLSQMLPTLCPPSLPCIKFYRPLAPSLPSLFQMLPTPCPPSSPCLKCYKTLALPHPCLKCCQPHDFPLLHVLILPTPCLPSPPRLNVTNPLPSLSSMSQMFPPPTQSLKLAPSPWRYLYPLLSLLTSKAPLNLSNKYN